MDTIKQIIKLVKPQYDTLECWVHSWPHIERVSNNAKDISELENIDYESSLISVYCHDLGRIEEEARKKKGYPSLPHALLSIEPTIKVLQKVGISGVAFNEIVEAVAVHSYRNYEGNNITAKILQDADKMSGFGPYGIMGAVKYFGEIDHFSSVEILANRDNREKIKEMGNISLEKSDEQVLVKVIEGLGFILKWYYMFHTKSAKDLIREEYEYTKQVRENLIKRIS